MDYRRIPIRQLFFFAAILPLISGPQSATSAAWRAQGRPEAAQGKPEAARVIVGKPAGESQKRIAIGNGRISLVLDYGNKASIVSMVVNGQKVISSEEGVYSAFTADGRNYSSLHLKAAPVMLKSKDRVMISGIRYGDDQLTIEEKWTFLTGGRSIRWDIERSLSKLVRVDAAASPLFTFDRLDTWEGAYQGYGGVAWFYLFNEDLCTYGVHTHSSDFWNSRTGNGLSLAIDAPGGQVAMKYTRTPEKRLACAVTVSEKAMLPRYDSGTNRRRFIRGRTDVWAPFGMVAGKSIQHITLSYFDFKEKYGRGKLAGINGAGVSAVLNTIARIGVIDSLHFGGNSWHTPYGPICLHEQYIAQMGLAIDDPAYLKGYQSCLDFYRDHAIRPDGRVLSRWAYTDEDMMPGQGNADGFYEAQWGFLMDSNPDLVTNVSELYDLTGDIAWVKRHRRSCEAALDWILKRDSNGNGLVEMMTDYEHQKKSSDWIDIIWASFENAFVNAKLYHALVMWTNIERQLGNGPKADHYEDCAARLKTSFNKPVREGGFWDNENGCYVHWIDRDRTIHGRNMVTPVNFMAIAYGICDDDARRKLILDAIEAQMQREKLFFWPLAMRSYAPGEGNDWQWPFPNYENGDLFLSWGSIAVKAYAEYKPDLALRYVKNVLNQYVKDGLAFQRYGRLKQDGLGDDILSGNCLAIVGLYQAIYGINPLYNRLYLNPHITSELAGTELNYRFRGGRLTITLDSNRYAVSNGQFKVLSRKDFGFMAVGQHLSYFDGASSVSAFEVQSEGKLTLALENWSAGNMEWTQTLAAASVKPLSYTIHQLKPDALYRLSVKSKPVQTIRSDAEGKLLISLPVSDTSEKIALKLIGKYSSHR